MKCELHIQSKCSDFEENQNHITKQKLLVKVRAIRKSKLVSKMYTNFNFEEHYPDSLNALKEANVYSMFNLHKLQTS